MEIQESSLPIFYFSRVLGLAPYLVKRNSKGRINEIKISIWLCIYSVCFLTTMVCLTVRFIVVDATSKTPIRMRTATSKFVTVFDVCIVVGAGTCGAISGIIGLKHMRNINKKLREADKELGLFNDEVKDKKRNIIMLAIVFLTMSGMIGMDITSRLRNVYKYKQILENENKETDSVNIHAYFPFYVLYYMLMALHTQFAQTALSVTRRYRRLNMALQSIFSLKKIMEIASERKHNKILMRSAQEHAEKHEILLPGANSPTTTKPTSKIGTISRAVQEEKNATSTMFSTAKNTNHFTSTSNSRTVGTRTLITRTSYFLDRLSFTHAILGDAVGEISSAFGLTLLIMLASCLLHLVATSYFLFLELLGDPDTFVATLQLLWCCFHVSRLLLIVEPCHMAAVEAGKTILIVCEVLRNCKDSTVEHILQRFWRQLLGDTTYYFTACGMCRINRQILTSLSGAIATYLVILIQFQKTDG